MTIELYTFAKNVDALVEEIKEQDRWCSHPSFSETAERATRNRNQYGTGINSRLSKFPIYKVTITIEEVKP